MTYTALHDLCSHQDAKGIEDRCQSHPEEIVQLDDHGFTPLHILCFRGQPSLKCLDSILSVDSLVVSIKDRHGDTPLHLALKVKDVDLEIIEKMVDFSPGTLAIPNKEGLLPLHAACRYCPGRLDIIRLLVKSYPEALRSHIKLGSSVERKGQKDVLKSRKPLDHFTMPQNQSSSDGLDLKFRDDEIQIRDGAYPIHILLHHGARPEVIEYMVSECPDCLVQIDKFGKSPLEVAKDSGYADIKILSLLT